MERSQSKDIWADGTLYEPYIGRWSRLVAKEMLRWLSLPVEKDWLDVGCGTGALTQIILEHGFPRAVMGVDPSLGFVEYAKAHIISPRVSFKERREALRDRIRSILPIAQNGSIPLIARAWAVRGRARP